MPLPHIRHGLRRPDAKDSLADDLPRVLWGSPRAVAALATLLSVRSISKPISTALAPSPQRLISASISSAVYGRLLVIIVSPAEGSIGPRPRRREAAGRDSGDDARDRVAQRNERRRQRPHSSSAWLPDHGGSPRAVTASKNSPSSIPSA